MADQQLRETVNGKYSRFDVFEQTSLLGSPKYYVKKNGKPHRGSFSRFDDAVDAAREEARKEG
nr:hypothetical protein [Thiocapsa sp. KS1]